MSEIPDVLKALMEFEEEDGVPLRSCGCGATQLVSGETDGFWQACETSMRDQWDLYLTADSPIAKYGRHCPVCGTRVGFTEDGRPYRVPYARIVEALATVVGFAFEEGYRAPIEYAGEAQNTAIVRAALAATEEGDGDDAH